MPLLNLDLDIKASELVFQKTLIGLQTTSAGETVIFTPPQIDGLKYQLLSAVITPHNFDSVSDAPVLKFRSGSVDISANIDLDGKAEDVAFQTVIPNPTPWSNEDVKVVVVDAADAGGYQVNITLIGCYIIDNT